MNGSPPSSLWLDNYTPKTDSTRTWQTIIRNALIRRLGVQELSPLLSQLNDKHRIEPTELAKILVSFRALDVGADDPLLYHYIETCFHKRLVRTGSLLLALLATSHLVKHIKSAQPVPRLTGLPSFEHRIFIMLTQQYMIDQVQETVVDVHGTVYALTRFMHVVTEYEMGKQLENGTLHSADAFAFGTYEALTTLVLSVFSRPSFRAVNKQAWWKTRRGMIVTETENFDRHVVQWIQSQLGGRLTLLLASPPFLELNAEGWPVLTNAQILHFVTDLPVVNTRAGLFIWLEARLTARPSTDDAAMLANLQARYVGNNQSIAVDFLFACFDVLTNALLRKESEHCVRVIKSFICNKAPLLLSMMSGFISLPMTIDASIQMALLAISMDAKAPLSEGAVEARDVLKHTRADFLSACVMHNLVAEATVHTINPDTPPAVTKPAYTKETLLTQCSHNYGRLETLIHELASTAGSAGAIANCIVEVIDNLCISKDTTALKTVCNILVKNISSLDIILQYVQPTNLLLHTCNLLNDWVHDQDQAELTPSYEEFASILLFVYAAMHRYDLKKADIGLADDDFISKLSRERSISKPLSQLTEDQNQQLGKWIQGLYDVDESGEPSGINDELIRQCPPQAFFHLVPTLFEQSVMACQNGVLPMRTFKGGLQLLVEPFLLPSLVGGLSWAVRHLWESRGDADIVMQMLDQLLRPSSRSPETKTMHRVVLSIVATPLHNALRNLAGTKADKKEIVSLIEVLRPLLMNSRTIDCSQEEVTAWTRTEEGGIAGSIRKTVESQIAWISNVGPTPPPNYTYRQFAFGVRLLGPEPILDTLTASIVEHTKNGNGSLAIEVCTAMITARLPDSYGTNNNNQRQHQGAQLSVRDVLNLRIADAQEFLEMPVSTVEALVRLHRRVEAQLVVNQMPELPLPLPIQDQAADQIMADLGLADAVGDVDGANSLGQVGDAAAAAAAAAAVTFGDADLNAVLPPEIDLTTAAAVAAAAAGAGATTTTTTDTTTGNITNATTDQASIVEPDQQNIMGDLNLDFGQDSQQLQDANDDDNIFAGLQMHGFNDDDLNFL